MKTKIVYVLTSSENDYYLEQTMISACSLKMHNPDCYAILVVDQSTERSMRGSRGNIMNYFNELKVIDVPAQYNQVQSSRFIKTSLRQHIKGDYLFIDGDTIICDDLSDIDNAPSPISAVLDCHLPISKHQHQAVIRKWAKSTGWNISSDHYFNSGVMFVQDSEISHEFYANWHKEWLENFDKGFPRDQPAMGKVNDASGGIIQEIPGKWNCQILDNGVCYFCTAKIIHYFSSRELFSGKSPFAICDNQIFDKIRNADHKIPEDIICLLKSKENLIANRTSLIGLEEAEYYYSQLASYLRKLYFKNNRIYQHIQRFLYLIKHPLSILK